MWTKGKIDGFDYYVKHYDKPSEFGIDGGCISKLEIRKNDHTLCGYDRGWDIEVKEEARAVYEQLLQMFNDKGGATE